MLNPFFIVTLFSSDCRWILGDTFILEALGSEIESVLRNFQKETLKIKQDIGFPWACNGFALFGSFWKPIPPFLRQKNSQNKVHKM